jgi:Subtilase family/PA domain
VSLRTRSAGDNGAGGCGANTGDSVAAIDQAVADGVDVINYSISGTSTDYLDAVEVAYLFAADAGVFVAASAGNSGPTASTVAHISPWLASVAAGTHDRSGTGTVTLGNGAQHQGASLTPAVGSSPLISATDAGVAGAHPDLVRQCFSANPLDGKPVLDPAKVAGKIVVCQRGGASPVPANARVDKSAAVKAAGGVGMIRHGDDRRDGHRQPLVDRAHRGLEVPGHDPPQRGRHDARDDDRARRRITRVVTDTAEGRRFAGPPSFSVLD